MAIGPTIPFTSIPWDDILFALLAGTMLLSALAVVTMRDIIRCGLAMMASFARRSKPWLPARVDRVSPNGS